MLVGAGEKLGTVLEPVELNDPSIPYVTNVTGAYVTDKKSGKRAFKAASLKLCALAAMCRSND